MINKILVNVKKQFLTALNSLSRLINQLPTEQQNQKAKKALNRNFFITKTRNEPIKRKDEIRKKVSRPKGNIRTETAIFNHPRSDLPQGRET